MATIVWVRGIPGLLTRIAAGEPFLPVDKWTKTALTNRVKTKHKRGSLELVFKDPSAKEKPAETKPKQKDES